MKICELIEAKVDTTQSPEFKRWFGNSKVVDENGEPLVVYHQTNKSAAEKIMKIGFSTNFPMARRQDEQVPDGIFFKPDTIDIKVGAINKTDIEQIQVYLRLINPVVVNDRSEIESAVNDKQYSEEAEATRRLDRDLAAEFDSMWARLPSRGRVVQNPVSEEEWDKFSEDWQNRLDVQVPAQAARARARLTQVLRNRGNDGLIIEKDAGSWKRATKTFVVLEPTQVKSAISNNGKFDPNNPDITKEELI